MFYRGLGVAFALSLTFTSLAQAADFQAVVYKDGTVATRHSITFAAEKLCKKAVSIDTDNYGSYEDCVADAIQNARPVNDRDQKLAAK